MASQFREFVMFSGQLQVTLVSHACVLVEANGIGILTDPWFDGTAFNDSWKLLMPPADMSELWDRIDYIWVSHEHPDHFHIPTLRAIPKDVRERVTVLFQRSSDSPKMIAAFNKMLGFEKVILLEHRKWTSLGKIDVYCYHSRQIDSALAVRSGGQTALNLNDCAVTPKDLATLRADIGPVDILLNQFSIAGSEGDEKKLKGHADQILQDMIEAHVSLDATVTVPFASFVYFCCSDNAHINPFINTPQHVAERFQREGLKLAVLLPGDAYAVGQEIDNKRSLDQYATVYGSIGNLPIVTATPDTIDRIETAFQETCRKLLRAHGRVGLMILKPVIIEIPDLGVRLKMSFKKRTIQHTTDEPNLRINSQPLHFMLSNSFGLQTLGVSGRYVLVSGIKNWYYHRALMAMMNAGVGLSMRQVFSGSQIVFFWRRRNEIFDQIRFQAKRVLG